MILPRWIAPQRGKRRSEGAPEAASRLASGRAALALAGFGPVSARPAGRNAESAAGARLVDWPLITVIAGLLLFGMVMVYSASVPLAESPRYHVTPAYFLFRHVLKKSATRRPYSP